MKKFIFEIELTDSDLIGDEFWENAIAHDGTGITRLTEYLETVIDESNVLTCSDKTAKDIIKLKKYES